MAARPAPPAASAPRPARRTGGFRHAARLVEDRVRAAGEKRGFAAARLITHWDEIVGPDTARMARPVKLGWARGQRSRGLGATLTLAVPGAAAPMVQMMAPRIVERVNAALGFAAVARVALAQGADAPAGMAEDGAPFAHRRPPAAATDDDTGADAGARAVAEGVQDPALRSALEALGRSVLSRSNTSKGLP